MNAVRTRDGTPPTGAFAVEGDRWRFAGQLVFDDAMAVLTAAAALPLPPSGIVDLAGLVHGDSSALAVLLALRRRAQSEGVRALSFPGVPPTLVALARAYGVESVLAA